jgi:hypothetical protein
VQPCQLPFDIVRCSDLGSRYFTPVVTRSGICLDSFITVLKILVLQLWVAGNAFSQQYGILSLPEDLRL